MLVLFGLIIALRICFFGLARKKDSVIDFENCTPSDYTVMVTNLPKTTTPYQVKKAFEDYFLKSRKNGPKIGEDIEVVEKVNFAYFIGSYINLMDIMGDIRVVIDAEKAKPEADRNNVLLEKKREEKNKINEQLQKLNETFNFYETC